MDTNLVLIVICGAGALALLTEVILSCRYNPPTLNLFLLSLIPSMLPAVPICIWTAGNKAKGMNLWQSPDGTRFFRIWRTYAPWCKRCRTLMHVTVNWTVQFREEIDPISLIDEREKVKFNCVRCSSEVSFQPLLGGSEWNGRH